MESLLIIDIGVDLEQLAGEMNYQTWCLKVACDGL
jgi:hypothetical protein